MTEPVATFDGIVQVKSAYYTKTNGPFPSTAIVRFIPQVSSPSVNGTLTFTDGLVTKSLNNAHVDFASLTKNVRGQYVSARITDRRIWWRNRVVSGIYNERRGDGSLVASTEKTPRELATLLMQAMGETGFDVSSLPNDADDRPFVDWRCANPATELWELCRDRGCEFGLTWGDQAKVFVVGSGALLPDGGVQTVSFGVDVGEYPATLRLCGDTVFQAKFKLIPYGSETDGEFRKIEDLSYAPDGADTWGGWELADPIDPLVDNASDNLKRLAREYIWRLYKIDGFADGTLNVPGYGAISNIEQILPISDTLLETFNNALDGKTYSGDAYVEGVWLPEGEDDEGVPILYNTNEGTRYDKSFRVFTETGFVLFGSPVFKKATGVDEIAPADLFLTTSFRVRAASNNQFVGYERDLSISGGNGIFPIVQDDLRRTIVAQYKSGDPTVLEDSPGHVVDNVGDMNTAADAILTSALPDFANYTAEQRMYMGVKDVDTDGAIKQVTISISGGGDGRGANTYAARNSEPEMGEFRKSEMDRIAQSVGERHEGRIKRMRKLTFNVKRKRSF